MFAHLYTSFSDLPAGRHESLYSMDGNSFDQTGQWLETLARHILEPSESLRLLCLSEKKDGELIVLLPLIAKAGFGSTILGHSLHGLSNYYTAHFGPLFSKDCDMQAVAQSLAEEILDSMPNWHTLDLNPLDGSAAWIDGFIRALQRRGCFAERYFRFGNWILDVQGRSFEQYFSGLSSRVRNTYRRKKKKLEQVSEASIEIVVDPGDLDLALEAYEQIYAISWKQAEPYPDFISDITRSFACRGWLRLGLLRIDGNPAAAQIWFVYDGTASIFKLAYDPTYADYSVGSILTNELMRHVIDEDRVSTVDYLCGDDRYKRDWMSDRRERIGIRVYRKGKVIGALRAASEQMVRHYRQKKG